MHRGWSPHELISQMNRTGNMQRIGATFLKVTSNNARIVHINAARLFVGSVDATEHSHPIPNTSSDLFQDQAGKAHTILERSAEFVDTFISSRGNKRTDQVAMGHMHFHCVNARSKGALGSIPVTLDQLVYLSSWHLFRHIAPACCGNGRCRLQWRSCVFRIALRSSVLQLYRNLGSVPMAGIDNGTQAGNRIVAIEARLQGAALRAAMHYRSLDGYQTEAPSRSRLIVSTRLVRPTPIRVGEVVSHRGNHKTVWHFHSADLDRRIKAAVWHGALLRLRSLA